MRLAQNTPVALEVGYWSQDEFPDLLGSTLAGMSLFALEHDCGVALAYADEEIDATDSDQRMADPLRVGKSTSLLRIRQLIFSATGKATVYVNRLLSFRASHIANPPFPTGAGTGPGVEVAHRLLSSAQGDTPLSSTCPLS